MAAHLKSTLQNLSECDVAGTRKRIARIHAFLVVAMAVTSTMTGRAMAAENRKLVKGRAAAVSLYNWSGLYLGINAGYGFGKSQNEALFSDSGTGTPLFATGASPRLDGTVGGVQTGYNWQSGIWLVSVEADIAATNQRTTDTSFCPGASCNPALAGFDGPVSIWHDQKLDWFSTLRGRFGVTVMPGALLYATAGAAIAGMSDVGAIFGANVDANGNLIPAGAGFPSHATKTGWVAGAGIETRLSGNWTGKIEYLHMDFGRDSIDAADPLNATPLAVNLNSRITDDVVRLGLSYRLASSGSAVPAYMIPARSYKRPIEGIWSWTGLYIGINAGYGFGKSQTDALFSDATIGSALFATGSSSRLDGLILGTQAGYDWQVGAWLFGLEADIQATSQQAGPTYVCPGAICNPTITDVDTPVAVAHDYKLDWFATIRGRVGAAITPNTVIYATGGLALAGIWNVGTVLDSTAAVAPLFDINERTKAGWTAGAGIESHLAGNWTAKIEYLHMDFGSASTATADNANATPITLGMNARITDDILRVGLNYRINGGKTTASEDKSDSSGKSGKTSNTPGDAVWTWTGPLSWRSCRLQPRLGEQHAY
jgi:outer membrane immunogenic protein